MELGKAVEPGGELSSRVSIETQLGRTVPEEMEMEPVTITEDEMEPFTIRRVSPDVSSRKPGGNLRSTLPRQWEVVELGAESNV